MFFKVISANRWKKFRYSKTRKFAPIGTRKKERWYFSVVDVVGVLTDSINPTDYLSVTLNLQRSWGQIVPR